jgi:Zeta toxin
MVREKVRTLGLVQFGRDDVVEIDADRFKAGLPEYEGGAGAAFLHAESSWLAQQARAIAIGRGCSLLNDAVGANFGKYRELVGRLHDNAYRVHLICLHLLDLHEVIRRAAWRAKEKGRTVSLSVIREAHEEIPRVFERLRQHVNSWQLVDADSKAVVWEGGDDKPDQVRDGKFVTTFLKTGRADAPST